MKKFILFSLFVFSIFIFNPLDSNAQVSFGEVGVAFADSSGNVLYEVDKNDYNVELNVQNVKYILMYTNSSTIKNNGYNLFYDFAIGYQGMRYPVGINVTQLLENRNSIQFTPSLFNVEGQIQGAEGYYSRYHLNVDFTASSSNAWYQVTLQLPTEMNFTFYSVYNKKFTQTSGNSGSQIESSTQDIINNQNKNTDKILDDNVDQSTNTATDFFNNFDSGNTGTLTDIISLPLDFLDKLNDTCSPIVLPVPYMGNITLPCIQTYLSTFLPDSFLNLIKLVINGFLMYKIIISLVDFINSLKDPNNNDLEVMDL